MAKIFGKPGGSLEKDNNSWVGNDKQSLEAARHGMAGEKIVAKILSQLNDNFVVLHDVTIPTSKANIDHIVIVKTRDGLFNSSNGGKWSIYLIDTKVWKPGRYVGLFNKMWRNWKRFKIGEKMTLTFAERMFKKSKNHPHYDFHRVYFILPSKKEDIKMFGTHPDASQKPIIGEVGVRNWVSSMNKKFPIKNGKPNSDFVMPLSDTKRYVR